MPANLQDLRDTALAAALAGGEVVLAHAGRDAQEKGAGDYVTGADRDSEQAIRELLASRTPGVTVVGEEEGGLGADRYWVVDPLDGTTNFVHGFPVVGVSVALVEDGEPVAGCVHAPFMGLTFTGARGLGAHAQGGTPLHVSTRPPEQAIVGTGFPFRSKERLPRYLATMTAALDRFEDLRRPGAASLDLAWVAAGVFDGFFELGLSSWDVAAGGLLIREAGGIVTDWSGGDGWLSGDILAGSPSVHAGLLAIA